MTSAVRVLPVPAAGSGRDPGASEAPAITDPAANAIQVSEMAKKKIINPWSSVMLAKRTTCSISW